jgi:outer membrane protein assembly factor BamE (lipoprotein component of BamABCDE complex)
LIGQIKTKLYKTLIALSILILCLFVAVQFDPYRGRRFDSALWKSANTNTKKDLSLRRAMGYSVEAFLQKGMTENEVLNVLGEPDENYIKGFEGHYDLTESRPKLFVYNLGYAYSSMHWLKLYFDKKDRLSIISLHGE